MSVSALSPCPGPPVGFQGFAVGTPRAAAEAMVPRPRVIVACPDRAECDQLIEWLSQEHEPCAARVLQGAVNQVQARHAHLVVADSRFAFDDAFLSICRGGGAPTPLVVVGDASAAGESAARRHGAFYVVRPVNRDLLMCSVAMALVDARPVRRSPRIPVARFEATADGMPVTLIDVANEGLRLEIPRGHRSALPPFFTVRVPLVGLSIIVQRVWMSAPGQRAAAHAWCGGALAENARGQAQRWLNFVNMVPRSL